MSEYPKWATPQRQEQLVELWLSHGDKCLLGHDLCPIPAHYAYTIPKAYQVAIPIKINLYDNQGNRRLDSEGNLLQLDSYKAQTVSLNKTRLSRLYDYLAEKLIEGWRAEDRQNRQAEEREWQREVHSLPSRIKPRCDFNADWFFDNQPYYYIEGFGISGLTFKPFVKVRLASSYTCLLVELDKGIFRGVSKSRKRKAIRYGKPLPEAIDKRVNIQVGVAVKHYLKW